MASERYHTPINFFTLSMISWSDPPTKQRLAMVDGLWLSIARTKSVGALPVLTYQKIALVALRALHSEPQSFHADWKMSSRKKRIPFSENGYFIFIVLPSRLLDLLLLFPSSAPEARGSKLGSARVCVDFLYHYYTSYLG